MSIYVKNTDEICALQTSKFRCMKVGSIQDTLERTDDALTIVRSLTVIVTSPPTGWSTYVTGLPDPTQPRDYWIDTANSFVRALDRSNSYPIPYVNPNNYADTICCKLQNSGQTLVVMTGTNAWTNFELVVTIKYADTRAF